MTVAKRRVAVGMSKQCRMLYSFSSIGAAGFFSFVDFAFTDLPPTYLL